MAFAFRRPATHSRWSVTRLVQMLVSARDRLSQLGAGDLRIRAAFEVSYRQLAKEDARLFRLLGLHPGPDVAAAAASLAGVSLDSVRATL